MCQSRFVQSLTMARADYGGVTANDGLKTALALIPRAQARRLQK